MDKEKFYRAAIEAHDAKLQVIRGKVNGVSLLRVGIFGALGGAVWGLIRDYSGWWVVGVVAFAAAFVAAVNWYFRLKDERLLLEKLVFVDSNEQAILAGEPNGFSDGYAFLDHYNYLDDLDVFGPLSVFHALNRTTTMHGTRALAALLKQSSLSAGWIREQQQAVRVLSGQAELRRLVTAKGLLTAKADGDLGTLTDWLNMRPQVYNRVWLRILIGAITLVNGGLLLAALSGGSYYPLVISIAVCWSITGSFSKFVRREHELIGHKQPVLEQYAGILAVFSEVDAGGSVVLDRCGVKAREAHGALQRLSRLGSFFDQRENKMVNLLLNSLAFYDLQCMVALERWKARYAPRFPEWIEVVGNIEALNSLATFAFNNDGYIYPEVAEREQLFLEAKQLAHPLIPEKRRVANDFGIGSRERLILVTGSNMSGKTTFLRTVGVNLLLAQIGAPVCAQAFTFTPMQLLTSLRISDSLQEQTSYFMAELKKLQRIVKQLETGAPTLVLIDEILRGTNSEDKTYGSEQFARKLAGYRCLSLFATHDLALGALEAEMPEAIANYCFESVIEDGELYFSYRLQRGMAKNRNASFLMKKLGII